MSGPAHGQGTSAGSNVVEVSYTADAQMNDGVAYQGYAGGKPVSFAAPANSTGRSVPLVIYLDGNGSSSRSTIEAIASKGYFVAAIPLAAGRGDIATYFEYCCESIDAVIRRSAELGFDDRRIAVWGNSWGGHMAAMLGTASNSRALPADRVYDWMNSISSVVTLGAPLDIEAMSSSESGMQSLRSWYGTSFARSSQDVQSWNPTRHVDQTDAAFMIVHGTSDSIVPFSQSALMTEALSQARVMVEFHALSGQGHQINAIDAVDSATDFIGRGFRSNMRARRSMEGSSMARDRSNESRADAHARSNTRRGTVLTSSAPERD